MKWDLSKWATQDSDENAKKADELSEQAAMRTLRDWHDSPYLFSPLVNRAA